MLCPCDRCDTRRQPTTHNPQPRTVAAAPLIPLECHAHETHRPHLLRLRRGFGRICGRLRRACPRRQPRRGGHSSRNGLARFERDVIESKPDHVILYFGINDAGNSRKLVPLEEFRRNMQSMVDRCRAAGVKATVLVTPNPIIAELWSQRRARRRAAVDLVRHEQGQPRSSHTASHSQREPPGLSRQA